MFGKVISGLNLLKKIERAGSEKGKPLCPVKIVDCGEVTYGKTQVAPREGKGKSWDNISSQKIGMFCLFSSDTIYFLQIRSLETPAQMMFLLIVLEENRGQIIKESSRIKERREREDIHHLILLVLEILIQIPIRLIVTLVQILIHHIQVHQAVIDTRGRRDHLERTKIGEEKERKSVMQISGIKSITKDQFEDRNGKFISFLLC